MNSPVLPGMARRRLLQLMAAGAGAASVSPWLSAARAETAAAPLPDGDPWRAFCRQLEQAGQQILRPEAPRDARSQAEGYRYLSRLLRAALEQEMEAADPLFPQFYQLSNETIKIGADNPDNHYLNAQIDGRHDYRVRGLRGTVSHVSFSTKAGSYGSSGSLPPTGSVDTETLKVESDGSFELILSATPKPGNWLPMTEESRMLIVRQTFLDRQSERPAEMTIECLDGPDQPAPLALAEVEARLLAAAAFVQGTASIFADWSQRFNEQLNDFSRLDQQEFLRQGGDASIFYGHGAWQLGEEEALLIDIPATDCEFWNFQVDNYWMESLDYRYFNIHLNRFNAHYREDGGVTIVLAHRDPGVPNWLTTTGHERGTMLYRVVHGKDPRYPTARRMKLAEVERSL